MFLLDDLAVVPVKSILSLFREIHKAAVKETADEADALKAELGTLYQSLEARAISEADFDAREQQILDRLDEIDSRESESAEEDDEEEQEYEEDTEFDEEADDDEAS